MSEKPRVFVLETKGRLSPERLRATQKVWESITQGTEIEGSKLLAVDGLLFELTGEGLPKVSIDADGNLTISERTTADPCPNPTTKTSG